MATTRGADAEGVGARRLARWLCGLLVLLTTTYLMLFVLNLDTRLPGVVLELVQSLPFMLVGGAIGALVASRRPSNPVGWLLLSMAIALGLQLVTEHYAILSFLTHGRALPGARWAAWSQALLLQTFFPILLAVMLMLVPDGRFLSAGWRRLAWGGLALNAVALVLNALTPGGLWATCCGIPFGVANPAGVPAFDGLAEVQGRGPDNTIPGIILNVLGLLVLVPAAVVSLELRRRRGTPQTRSQIGLVLLTLAVAAVLFILGVLVALLVSDAASSELFAAAITLVAIGLPVAIALAILRHGLFDVEVVIRKTILYATTAMLLVAVFLTVALVVGAVAGRSQVGQVVAAAAIGVSLQPAIWVARKVADRLVYGKRATPFEVLADFSERVAGPHADGDVLARMAQVLGEAVGAIGADVWLHVDRELRVAACWPAGRVPPGSIPVVGDELPPIASSSSSIPVRDGERLLGALAVTKPSNDPITPNEAKLIAHLASQAALVLRNVRLIEELRASRQRLVAAQDQERRRLERNIHDGAQQQLVALAVKLRLLQQLTERDPQRAHDLAGGLQGELQAALDDLRDLARGIYPPLLADKGLITALEAQARRSAQPVTVSADEMGRFPREVEAAVYFCCLEAMQNAAKYSEAPGVRVDLRVADGELRFVVSDEGAGFEPDRTPLGSGLENMSDRLSALGGTLEVRSSPGAGTTIIGRLPAAPV